MQHCFSTPNTGTHIVFHTVVSIFKGIDFQSMCGFVLMMYLAIFASSCEIGHHESKHLTSGICWGGIGFPPQTTMA
jgi:hypothetical protein